MTLAPAPLALGRPVFTDPQLAAVARQSGVPAAWQMLLAQADPAAALGGVRGPFAMSVCGADSRAFAAVDRFGQHTLCYTVANGQLRVAERADQLAGSAAEIEPQALFDYLYFHTIPSPRTVFRGVHRLPPGHFVHFEDGRLTVAPYWTAQFDEPRSADFDTLKEEFRGLLRDAVTRSLDGGKAGCFLSGGTDSSTIAGMTGVVRGSPAATYSIGFDAQGYDEMAFARIAARHFGTEHHEYYVTPDDLVRSMADVATHYDQPFGNSSALPAYYCARMARDDGVTRIMAGDGGDELFGGNSRYAKQRVFGWYGLLPAPLRSGLLQPLFEQPAVARLPLLRKGASYIEQARVPMPDRLHMYNLVLRLGLADVFTADFLRSVDSSGPVQQQRAVWQAARAGSDLNRTLAYDWRYTLAESDLPKVRGTTQLAGIDVGFPMLDDALLQFSLKLPVAYKMKGFKLRWFFKEALRGFLPDEILAKKKQGFGLPFGVWANNHAPLKTLAADALGSMKARGIVRPDFIDALLATHLPAYPGYYGEMVWILTMLEFWLRRHAPDWRLQR